MFITIPERQHIVPMQRIAEDVASRGHRVTIASPEVRALGLVTCRDELGRWFANSRTCKQGRSEWVNSSSAVHVMSAGKHRSGEFEPSPSSNPFSVQEEHMRHFAQYQVSQHAHRACCSSVVGVLTARLFFAWQRPMYDALVDAFRDDPPQLLVCVAPLRQPCGVVRVLTPAMVLYCGCFQVIDRFTFAGFDLAHSLNLSYVVHSPTLLLDLDNPPAHIAAPFSGVRTRVRLLSWASEAAGVCGCDCNVASLVQDATVWQRCLTPVRRLRFNLAMLRSLASVNSVCCTTVSRHAWALTLQCVAPQRRGELGLAPLPSWHDLVRRSLLISDSCFGVEDARMVRPTVKLVRRAVLGAPSPLLEPQ